jgi:hypothetical protein
MAALQAQRRGQLGGELCALRGGDVAPQQLAAAEQQRVGQRRAGRAAAAAAATARGARSSLNGMVRTAVGPVSASGATRSASRWTYRPERTSHAM